MKLCPRRSTGAQALHAFDFICWDPVSIDFSSPVGAANHNELSFVSAVVDEDVQELIAQCARKGLVLGRIVASDMDPLPRDGDEKGLIGEDREGPDLPGISQIVGSLIEDTSALF